MSRALNVAASAAKWLFVLVVSFAAPTVSADTLTASPTSLLRGSGVTLTWSYTGAVSAANWIGIFPVGSGTAIVNTTANTASGTRTVTVPTSAAPGTYEARLFTQSGTTLTATSNSFEVTAPPPPTLSVTPASLMRGSNVTATWANIENPSGANYIGVFVPGSANNTSIANVSATTTNGSKAITIPFSAAPATYELRFFAQSGQTVVATSDTFEVTAPPPPTLSASPASVLPGNGVTATWANIENPSGANWIGVFLQGSANNAPIGTTFANTSSGTKTITVPASAAPGIYELRFFAQSGNTLAATSNSFTVGVSIGGTITKAGSAFANVSLTANNGGTCTPSDASGQYACLVPSGWSGSVTPALSGHSFSPASHSYTNVTVDLTGQDFAATAVAASRLYFIHVDHLNTPRLIADSIGTAVWRNDNSEPFGDSVPDENPSGLGVFEMPLRFLGQYSDKETGLAYNMARDYWASGGRYVESDLIGLKGGLNTYAYVGSNPLSFTDPTGLLAVPTGSAFPGGPALPANPNASSSKPVNVCISTQGPDFARCRENCRFQCQSSLGKSGRMGQGMSYFRCLNECYLKNGCM